MKKLFFILMLLSASSLYAQKKDTINFFHLASSSLPSPPLPAGALADTISVSIIALDSATGQIIAPGWVFKVRHFTVITTQPSEEELKKTGQSTVRRQAQLLNIYYLVPKFKKIAATKNTREQVAYEGLLVVPKEYIMAEYEKTAALPPNPFKEK